jgi:hypothetical protein
MPLQLVDLANHHSNDKKKQPEQNKYDCHAKRQGALRTGGVAL